MSIILLLLLFNPFTAIWTQYHIWLFWLIAIIGVLPACFIQKYLHKTVPKFCKAVDYVISLNLLPEGIEYLDNRRSTKVFIPKDEIRYMYGYGDCFYGSGKEYLYLSTSIKSNLSLNSVGIDFDREDLKTIFIPTSVYFNYSYIIPCYSDDGVDIPSEIEEKYGISLEWKLH